MHTKLAIKRSEYLANKLPSWSVFCFFFSVFVCLFFVWFVFVFFFKRQWKSSKEDTKRNFSNYTTVTRAVPIVPLSGHGNLLPRKGTRRKNKSWVEMLVSFREKKIKKEKDLVGWTLKAVFQIACLKRWMWTDTAQTTLCHVHTLSTSPATVIPPGLENSHLMCLKDKNLLETFQICTGSFKPS